MIERVNIVINGCTAIPGEATFGESVRLRYRTDEGSYTVSAAERSLTVRFKGESSYELYLAKDGTSRLSLSLGDAVTSAAAELVSYELKSDGNGVFISADYALEGESRTIVIWATKENSLQ